MKITMAKVLEDPTILVGAFGIDSTGMGRVIADVEVEEEELVVIFNNDEELAYPLTQESLTLISL